ncbi:MAG: formyltransferase [Candidatus Binatia bacterium]
MRSVVFAYSDVGYVCLETLLAQGAEIAAVVTHDDDPGEQVWFRSVRGLAERHGLPVFTDARVDTPEWLARLRGWQPDFLFSFYYRRLLPPAVLDCARRGAFNLHGSLLPRYRGRCPVNWVLIHGETETGVTLHYMVARADAGDIVAQRRVPIADDDTAHRLYGKLTDAAAALLRETYPRLCDGSAPRVRQDLSQGSYFGGRTPADGRIDWRQSARQIYNLVRAVARPYPGATTRWQHRELTIWWAQPTAGGRNAPPGTIVGIDDEGFTLQTGDGGLRALRVQLDGEPESTAAAWARRHDVKEGTVFT